MSSEPLGRWVGDVGTFLDKHWARAPLHRPAAGPGDVAELFTLDDVDRLISSSALRYPSFRMVRDGGQLPVGRYTKRTRIGGRWVDDVVDPGRVWDLFADGATLVLQALHRHWAPLARLAREFELVLTHPVQVNAYVTPAEARGLGVHYDTHDVVVIQFAGSKRWQVFEPSVTHPTRAQKSRSSSPSPGPELLDVTLTHGDVLYLPRGFPHAARTADRESGHLTVGVLTYTWLDVLGRVVELAMDDVSFRQPLPAGFADDPEAFRADLEPRVAALREWLAHVDVGGVSSAFVDRFWRSRQPVLEGQLAQILALGELDDGSVVRRRSGAVCRLQTEGDRLRVTLADRELDLPGSLVAAVRLLVSGELVRVGDLADLDLQSRTLLVRRLVREGLLELAPGA